MLDPLSREMLVEGMPSFEDMPTPAEPSVARASIFFDRHEPHFVRYILELGLSRFATDEEITQALQGNGVPSTNSHKQLHT